jgi:hypothetical protein
MQQRFELMLPNDLSQLGGKAGSGWPTFAGRKLVTLFEWHFMFSVLYSFSGILPPTNQKW